MNLCKHDKGTFTKAYKETFATGMTDVTGTAEPAVNIWPYVEALVKDNMVNKYVYENKLVEKVYRNSTSTFDHVLLPAKNSNVFIVIVVDLVNKLVFGHSVLDLNLEYGL